MLIVGPLTLLAGIAFIILRSIVDPAGEVDFRFFWLAGELWETGIDPYSERFREVGAQLLPPGNVVIYWFYPPQWWIICRGLALLDLEHAVMVWRLASGLMILAGTFLLVSTLANGITRRKMALAALVSGFALVIEPTANLLAFGQSAGLVYLSLALFVVGALRRQSWMIGLAVFLATFKPQVGAPMLVMMLLLPSYRMAALGGLAAAGVLALPQLVEFGWLLTLREFISNLRAWSDLGSNTPTTSSGPINLLTRFGVHGIDLGYQMILAFIAVLLAGWQLRRRPDEPLTPLFFLTAAIAGLMPLHIYDLTILIIPLALFAVWARSAGVSVILGSVAFLLRPSKIEVLFGVQQYGSGVSAGLIFLDLVALVLLAFSLRAVFRRRPLAEPVSRPVLGVS